MLRDYDPYDSGSVWSVRTMIHAPGFNDSKRTQMRLNEAHFMPLAAMSLPPDRSGRGFESDMLVIPFRINI